MQILSIVEGDGEVEAVPILIRRLLSQWELTQPVSILRPIRIPKTKLMRQQDFARAATLATHTVGPHGVVLVFLDADDHCPAKLGPDLLGWFPSIDATVRYAVVVIKHEFEAWFLAVAGSIAGHRGLSPDTVPPSDPEAVRGCKEWLTARWREGGSYNSVLDQPAFAACMDISHAQTAPSFARFARRLQAFVTTPE